jgi:rfaE bifunctional protein nucleotidyltransferase chain/domain
MIVPRKLLSDICRVAKTYDKKIVFTNGCFDIIHSGHIKYLNDSKKLGDILVVGLNSDASVKRLKGSDRPINSENDRALVLSALKSIDYVSIFDEDTPLELITEIIPDIITKGGDYNPETIVGADIVINNGGKVVIIQYVEGKSTTSIIDKMKQGTK